MKICYDLKIEFSPFFTNPNDILKSFRKDHLHFTIENETSILVETKIGLNFNFQF